MIRFKDKVFEDYFIDPVTAVITDKDGNVQNTAMCGKYLAFKDMPVHRIQAHTAWGYKEGYVVHHIDKNRLNNALSNLAYLTYVEHRKIHADDIITDYWRQRMNEMFQTRVISEETRLKISKANKGKEMFFTDEHKRKLSEAHTRLWADDEYRARITDIMKKNHYKMTEADKQRQSEKMKGKTKGMTWWNNGIVNTRSRECPEGYTEGRIKKNKENAHKK